jgi:hypothetical protein
MQPHGPAGGGLVVHATYPGLAFMLGLFKPVVTVDGTPMKIGWKSEDPLPLPPGVHTVKVHVPYLWEVGKAQLSVDNRAGQPVRLYYAAPYLVYSRGAIGSEPVQSPDRTIGLGIFWGGIALAALIIICGCGSILISAASSSN